jgi:predicted dehydrogenase
MSTPTHFRAAVIGVGVGRAHMKGYQASPNTELVAICDTDSAKVHSVGDEYRIQARFTDYRQMLAEIKPDLVSICLPNFLHREVSIAASEHGAHVICEKPMATTVDEARAMLNAAAAAKRELAISYNYRYRADAQWVKKVISSGGLGEINFIHAAWRRETGIPGSGWFGRKALSGGGPLIDLGVHVLDLTLWFLGFPKIQTVSGSTRSVFGAKGQKVWGLARWMNANAEPFDVEDGAVGFLRFGNGASAILQAAWADHLPPGTDMFKLEIHGSHGAVHITVPNYRHEDTLRMYCEIEGEPVTITPGLRNLNPNGHELMIVDTIKALQTGRPIPSSGLEGLEAVRVLEAMYTSAEQGAEVKL